MKASAKSYDTLFGIVTVAHFIGASVEEAKRLIAAGELPSFSIGTMACASKEVLRAWLDLQGCPECRRTHHVVVYWGEVWAVCNTHEKRWRSKAALGRYIGPCEYSIVESYEVVERREAQL